MPIFAMTARLALMTMSAAEEFAEELLKFAAIIFAE